MSQADMTFQNEFTAWAGMKRSPMRCVLERLWFIGLAETGWLSQFGRFCKVEKLYRAALPDGFVLGLCARQTGRLDGNSECSLLVLLPRLLLVEVLVLIA